MGKPDASPSNELASLVPDSDCWTFAAFVTSKRVAVTQVQNSQDRAHQRIAAFRCAPSRSHEGSADRPMILNIGRPGIEGAIYLILLKELETNGVVTKATVLDSA
jgi:hypothetical protein